MKKGYKVRTTTHTYTHTHIYISVYIYNRMAAYLRPLVSCCPYTAIIRQKKNDFGEIEKIEKIQSKEYLR